MACSAELENRAVNDAVDRSRTRLSPASDARLPPILTMSSARPSSSNVESLISRRRSASRPGCNVTADAHGTRSPCGSLRLFNPDVAHRGPNRAIDGAASRDHAGLGASVDLEHQRVPHCFAARRQPYVKGAVALTTRRGPASDADDCASARRCTGAVTSTRRPLMLRQHREHFVGMQRMLRRECANGPCNAISTVDSRPYMCCGEPYRPTPHLRSARHPNTAR